MQNTGLIKVSSYIVHVDRFGLQVCMYEHMHAHVRCLVYSPWFSFDIYIYIYIYIYMGESNGKLPLRTCPGCSVPEPYQSPD